MKKSSDINPQAETRLKAPPSQRPSQTLGFAFAALILIGIVGFWGMGVIKQEIRGNLKNQLETTLRTVTESIKTWSNERITSVEVSAAHPVVRQNILRLAAKNKNRKLNARELLQTPELKVLRENLGRIIRRYGFIGFVLFDPSGYQIGAFLDEAVGHRDIVKRSDFFQRALSGHSVISTPFASAIPLPQLEGPPRNNWPTMLVATPIWDDSGKVAAVLGFRIRPETHFHQLFTSSRPGDSGETYAFDAKGRMISKSRFEPQLRALGLIADRPDSTSILNVEIRDPQGNLLEGYVPGIERAGQPFTLMAQSALNKQTGVNVEGYNDYRGVPVVGAWIWLDNFNFGITHEIDVKEALVSLTTLRLVVLSIYGLMISAAGFALFQMSRKQKAQQEAYREYKRNEETALRMRSIFDHTAEAIIITDETGIIESFNPAAEKIFGYTGEEVIGQNIDRLMPEPYGSEHRQYLEKYNETGREPVLGQRRELVGLRKDGETFLLEITASRIRIEGNIKFTGILRDITERKQSEDEIQQARQEAEKASQAKSQFLSRMSHELRTPMNAILGFAQILAEETRNSSDQNQQECVGHILQAGNHLLELINEILDLSRIEAGKMSVSLEPVEIKSLIREALTLAQPLIIGTSIQLINKVQLDTHPFVQADRVRLRQVLLNLISNAIKYNRDNGSVEISCKHLPDNRLVIAIKDTGHGIPVSDQEILFQPFQRLNEKHATEEGTGIGLTICKQLMDLMGGQIHLESEMDRGSTFFIELPCIDPSEQIVEGGGPKESEALPAVSGNTGPIRILYIEDNPANMFLMKQILKNHRPPILN